MTLESFVSAVQLEVGAGIVIEVPNFPISGIVATVATVPQFPAMGVVALMTRIAVDGRFVFVKSAFVATVALCDTMLA